MADRVIYTQDDGVLAVIIPAAGLTAADVLKDVPAGKTGTIVDESTLPTDRMFRAAWVESGGVPVSDLTKCKTVAHELRRTDRDTKLKPLDDQINWAVGNTTEQATIEAQRATIRTSNSTSQTNIDAATDEAGLRTIISTDFA